MASKIFFDHQIFTKQKIGGISNYFFNLGIEMIKMNLDIKFFSPLHRNKYLLQIPKKNRFGSYVNFLPGRINNSIDLINFHISKKYLDKNSYDLIHQTYYSKKILSKLPKILTVFDLISEKYPNYFKNFKDLREEKKFSIENSQHLICISETTKNDLIEYFGVDPKKITVTLLASNLSNDLIEIKNKMLKNFILFIGNRRGYKNFDGFIEAFSKSNLIKKNFKIMIVGGEKFGNEDFEILKKNEMTLDHIQIANEKKMSLSYIYSNVALMVYPSLYEGFGLPILEAMACGCPVLSSNGGSLQEVGGKNIEYFDPLDTDDMSFKFDKILSSNTNLKNQIAHGYKQSQKFSWEKCAKETIQVYQNI